MVDKSLTNNWSYEHFVIYLYLCIADSDYNITDDEIEEIHGKVSKTLENGNYMKAITEVLREFKNHTDYEKTDIIANYASHYCKNEEVRSKILADLEDVMEADGIIKSVEMIMFRYIKKTLEDI